jgi:hypothetical protein
MIREVILPWALGEIFCLVQLKLARETPRLLGFAN